MVLPLPLATPMQIKLPSYYLSELEQRSAVPNTARTNTQKIMTNDVWKRDEEREKKSNQLGSVDFIILLKSGCSIIKFQIEHFLFLLFASTTIRPNASKCLPFTAASSRGRTRDYWQSRKVVVQVPRLPLPFW